MSGYVRIHRPLFEDHPAFRNDAEAMAFAWLIVKAAWQPAKVRYKGRILFLDRGQVAVSVRDFASAMDRDKAWVERLLKRLRDEAMLTTRNETGVTVITICNYNEYQADVGSRETADETPRETGARQERDTEQRIEEGKNISSEPKGSSPRAWVCPVGVPSQVWVDLLANRKRKRHANTATAWRRFQNDLSRVSAQTGIPPPKLIEHAAAHGWAGIYEPGNYGNERSDRDPTTAALERLLGGGAG